MITQRYKHSYTYGTVEFTKESELIEGDYNCPFCGKEGIKTDDCETSLEWEEANGWQLCVIQRRYPQEGIYNSKAWFSLCGQCYAELKEGNPLRKEQWDRMEATRSCGDYIRNDN